MMSSGSLKLIKKYFDLSILNIKNYLIIDDFFPKIICDQLYFNALYDPTVHVRYFDYNAREFDSGKENYSLKEISYNYVAPRISFFDINSYIRSWSLVMDNIAEGVGPHSDPGSTFTCNVWVTPNNCVYDTSKNGLILYNKKINSKFPIENLMKDNKLESLHLSNVGYNVIPYKCNRAIIFRSDTIHKTNNVHMKCGHMNKRVSYTFLYGK
jgi:hypothetical protein